MVKFSELSEELVLAFLQYLEIEDWIAVALVRAILRCLDSVAR